MRRITFLGLIFKQCYYSSWFWLSFKWKNMSRNVACRWLNKRNGCTKFLVFVVQLSSSSIIFLLLPSCTWGVCVYWINKGITDQNCGCCQWDACKSYGHFSNWCLMSIIAETHHFKHLYCILLARWAFLITYWSFHWSASIVGQW